MTKTMSAITMERTIEEVNKIELELRKTRQLALDLYKALDSEIKHKVYVYYGEENKQQWPNEKNIHDLQTAQKFFRIESEALKEINK